LGQHSCRWYKHSILDGSRWALV